MLLVKTIPEKENPEEVINIVEKAFTLIYSKKTKDLKY